METPTIEKRSKANKPDHFASIRVRKETRRLALQLLAKVNRKDFGRPVLMDAIVALAFSFIKPEHLQALQEGSLSHQDRLERDYKAYVGEHGPISKDVYLGKRLSGEIASKAGIVPEPPTQNPSIGAGPDSPDQPPVQP